MSTLTKDFLSFMLCQGGGEAGSKQRQDTWPKLAKEVFHTTAHHAQYIKWGQLPGRVRSLLGSSWASVGGWWVVVFSSLVISLIIIGGSSSDFVLYLNYRTVLISTPGSYILSILLPIPPGAGGGRWGGSERVAVWFWLGLNHDKQEDYFKM